jgi:hypothetical protein
VLFGGEEHSLVATLPAGTGVPDGMMRLGRVIKGEGVWLEDVRIEGGFDHYRAD